MTIIFKAKTREGFVIKTLAELLQNNIKIAVFIIDNNGIRLRMADTQKDLKTPFTQIFDLELNADNFSAYKYKLNEEMRIGINLLHFHKMLKTVKKRDSIKFFIDDNNITELGIKVTPKESNRTTTSYIKIINNTVNKWYELPQGYDKPVIVPSGEFQKMCKSLSPISPVTHISAKNFLIQFSCDGNGVMKRVIEFGETEDSQESEHEESEEEQVYEEDFDTEQLCKISKLSGLGSIMQIYPKTDVPLMIKTTVGTLGRLCIYLRSKSGLEEATKQKESEEEGY